jgi:hypothetical protein
MFYRLILIEEGTGEIFSLKGFDPTKLCLKGLHIANKKFNGGGAGGNYKKRGKG